MFGKTRKVYGWAFSPEKRSERQKRHEAQLDKVISKDDRERFTSVFGLIVKVIAGTVLIALALKTGQLAGLLAAVAAVCVVVGRNTEAGWTVLALGAFGLVFDVTGLTEGVFSVGFWVALLVVGTVWYVHSDLLAKALTIGIFAVAIAGLLLLSTIGALEFFIGSSTPRLVTFAGVGLIILVMVALMVFNTEEDHPAAVTAFLFLVVVPQVLVFSDSGAAWHDVWQEGPNTSHLWNSLLLAVYCFWVFDLPEPKEREEEEEQEEPEETPPTEEQAESAAATNGNGDGQPTRTEVIEVLQRQVKRHRDDPQKYKDPFLGTVPDVAVIKNLTVRPGGGERQKLDPDYVIDTLGITRRNVADEARPSKPKGKT